MARTTIAVQRLQALDGQEVTFQNFDAVNGMQCQNLGIQVILVKAGSGVVVQVGIPSVPDPFDRSGDIVTTVGPDETVAFGPFTVPTVWGDGAAKLFVDGTATSGTATIAVVEVG